MCKKCKRKKKAKGKQLTGFKNGKISDTSVRDIVKFSREQSKKHGGDYPLFY